MLNFKYWRTEGPNSKLLHVLQWCIAVWAAMSVMQIIHISFLLFIISQVLIQVSKHLEKLLIVTWTTTETLAWEKYKRKGAWSDL